MRELSGNLDSPTPWALREIDGSQVLAIFLVLLSWLVVINVMFIFNRLRLVLLYHFLDTWVSLALTFYEIDALHQIGLSLNL